MFNPLRAYKIKSNKISNFLPVNKIYKTNQKLLNDKNIISDIFFFTGSFWVVRRDVFLKNNGLQPFQW
jgi:hypothetical protein